MSLLLVQILIAVVAMVISGVLTAAIALVLKYTMGWRIPEADERAGIDITHHAESGYDLGGTLATRRERTIPTAHGSFPLDPSGPEPRNPAPGGGEPLQQERPPIPAAQGRDPLGAEEHSRPVATGETR